VYDFASEVAPERRSQKDVCGCDFYWHAGPVEGSDAHAEVLHVRRVIAFRSGLEGCPDDAGGHLHLCVRRLFMDVVSWLTPLTRMPLGASCAAKLRTIVASAGQTSVESSTPAGRL